MLIKEKKREAGRCGTCGRDWQNGKEKVGEPMVPGLSACPRGGLLEKSARGAAFLSAARCCSPYPALAG